LELFLKNKEKRLERNVDLVVTGNLIAFSFDWSKVIEKYGL